LLFAALDALFGGPVFTVGNAEWPVVNGHMICRLLRCRLSSKLTHRITALGGVMKRVISVLGLALAAERVGLLLTEGVDRVN
jgi:hypothetical protein